MVVDTGTVRLVIFLGMFLVFAGDYSSLITSIFGNGQGRTTVLQNSSLRRPEGPPKIGQRSSDSPDKEDVESGKLEARKGQKSCQ